MEAIQQAITELSDTDRRCLAVWLNEIDNNEWDTEMEANFSPGGRGMYLLEQVNQDIRDGKATPFEEGLQAAKANPGRSPGE